MNSDSRSLRGRRNVNRGEIFDLSERATIDFLDHSKGVKAPQKCPKNGIDPSAAQAPRRCFGS